MQALRSRPGLRRGGIIYLSTEELLPNPVQPRKHFDDTALDELADSLDETPDPADVASFFVTLGQAGYLQNTVLVNLVENPA